MKKFIVFLFFVIVICTPSAAQKADTVLVYNAKVSQESGDGNFQVQFRNYTVGDTISILTQENILITNVVFGHDGIKWVPINRKYTSFKIRSIGGINKNTSKTVCFEFKGLLNKEKEWRNFCLSFGETLSIDTNLSENFDKKKVEISLFNVDSNLVKVYVYHNVKAGRVNRKDTLIINSKPFLISIDGKPVKTCELAINPKKDTTLEVTFHNSNGVSDYEKYSKLHIVLSAKSGKENHRDTGYVVLTRNRRTRLTISIKNK